MVAVFLLLLLLLSCDYTVNAKKQKSQKESDDFYRNACTGATYGAYLNSVTKEGRRGILSVYAGELGKALDAVNKVAPSVMAASLAYDTYEVLNEFSKGSTKEGTEKVVEKIATYAGASYGASAGAAVGSCILPGVGTMVGGIIGGAIGGGVGGSAGEAVNERMKGEHNTE